MRVHRSGAAPGKMTLLLLGLCTLALGVAGCSSGNSSSSRTSSTAPSTHVSPGTSQKTRPAAPPLALRAYRATTREGSARVRIEEVEHGLPLHPGQKASPSTIRISGSGAVSFAESRAKVSIGTSGAGRAEIRQIGYTIYEKLPANGSSGQRGRWVRLDLLELAGGRGEYLAQLASSQLNDPVHQLAYLEGVIPAKTRKLGRGEVRGVTTTRYRMVVDLDRVARQNPAGRKLYEDLKKDLGSSTLPITVWLDGKDRVRRFEATVPIEIPRTKPGKGVGSERGRIRISNEYYGFGAPVSVKAPPKDETTNVKIPTSG